MIDPSEKAVKEFIAASKVKAALNNLVQEFPGMHVQWYLAQLTRNYGFFYVQDPHDACLIFQDRTRIAFEREVNPEGYETHFIFVLTDAPPAIH